MICNTSKWKKNQIEKLEKTEKSPQSGKNEVIFFVSLRI